MAGDASEGREASKGEDMHTVRVTVRAMWDAEAGCWIAESDDVPGLATGADTLDELFAKLRIVIPELLELNDRLPVDDEDGSIPFSVIAQDEVKRPRAA